MSRCRNCGWWNHPPAPSLPALPVAGYPQRSALGRATVQAFTINRHQWSPEASTDAYVIAIVEFPEQEGLRLTTNIIQLSARGGRHRHGGQGRVRAEWRTWRSPSSNPTADCGRGQIVVPGEGQGARPATGLHTFAVPRPGGRVTPGDVRRAWLRWLAQRTRVDSGVGSDRRRIDETVDECAVLALICGGLAWGAPGGGIRPGGRGQAVRWCARPGASASSPGLPTISLNWSGYAVTSNKAFNYVHSEFVQPAIACPGVRNQWTSNWVGLDGFKYRDRRAGRDICLLWWDRTSTTPYL